MFSSSNQLQKISYKSLTQDGGKLNLGLGPKISNRPRKMTPTKPGKIAKDTFADLGFGAPPGKAKTSAKKKGGFGNFGNNFADFGNNKKKNDDFDFSFGVKPTMNKPKSRVARAKANQQGLMDFGPQKGAKMTSDTNLLSFNSKPKNVSRNNNTDADFL